MVLAGNLQKQTKQLSTFLGEDGEVVEKALKYVGIKWGVKCNMFDLSVVYSGLNLNNRIISMNEGFYDECKKLLVKIAYVYCSIPRESQVSFGFDEIVGVIKRRYSDLTLEEVSLAFELAAIGRFEGISLKSYGAGFNLDMVGNVLEKYRVWRDRVKWGVLDLLDKVKRVEVSKDLEDEYRKTFEWWMGIMSKVRGSGDVPRWELLPYELLWSLNERGFIKYEGDGVVRKVKYIEGIEFHVKELRDLKMDSGAVMSYGDKVELQGKLEQIKMWREGGGDLSKSVIPQFLREKGKMYGLKLFVVDYLEKLKKGEVN